MLPSSYRGYSNYAALPAGERLGFHINAVAHGRARCHVERPDCAGCPVAAHCVAPEAGRYSRRGDGPAAPPDA